MQFADVIRDGIPYKMVEVLATFAQRLANAAGGNRFVHVFEQVNGCALDDERAMRFLFEEWAESILGRLQILRQCAGNVRKREAGAIGDDELTFAEEFDRLAPLG